MGAETIKLNDEISSEGHVYHISKIAYSVARLPEGSNAKFTEFLSLS